MESINIPITDISSTFHPLLQTLQPSSTADGIAALLFLLTALGYLTRGRLWEKPDPYYHLYFERPQQQPGQTSARSQTSRNIAQRLEEGDHKLVVFWGSQSGTAERFAEQLGRECSARFGLNSLVADLSDYDVETVALIPQSRFAIFILSTYGEGDPSDNAAGFWDWIKKAQDQGVKLDNLRYLAFGLGNSNYKYYNRVIDVVADALDAFSATALLPKGRADDANGATEEDFQAWKDDVFAMFRNSMRLEEKLVQYQPAVDIQFTAPNERETQHATPTHQSHSNTCSAIVPLTIKNSRELFTSGDRNCIHMDLDLTHHPDIYYKTGDYIGIWPCNLEEEIDILLSSLGLHSRKNEPLSINPLSTNSKRHVPSLTTLTMLFRNHLEISGPVSRKTVLELAPFAPTPDAKATILELGQNKDRYAELTANTHITLARLLQLASPTEPWTNFPLSWVIESLLPLQPRYYSISSSSVISPRKLAITALVSNRALSAPSPGQQTQTIHGLTSNYLLSASSLPSNSPIPTPTYNHLDGTKLFAHIRKSKFKLPITSSTPLILISAGTGFAPFRAFLSERSKLHSIGKPVGKMVLFFGCRSPDEDFIYREELEKMKEALGERLEIVTAFSRVGEGKTYVQDRVGERGREVLEMLDSGASLYVCGKASMAREVDGRIEEVVKERKGLADAAVKEWTDGLKRRGKWRADVWG
ncbi:cytochrome P450 reductase 2 [Zopfia rhizophila CBS 207.26]|uniref:NADPH--cytochrome P450 reductase n=1 Tax=Zopfia rhizophila CBS 207.26 TaxID=1314779 RepID=A0A6A6DF12_9PEZI|nr:cytochrome P450 reductase 2 [Zopfia rhizophila CBS 207.26]